MKKLKPNYSLLLKSAIASLQTAYSDYKKALIENITCCWIGIDGTFITLDGAEERNQQIKELEKEVIRLQSKVEEIKGLMESEGMI